MINFEIQKELKNKWNEFKDYFKNINSEMPNYATNRLTIRGNKKYIDEIVGEEFCFKNSVPPPQENDMSWCIYNWGVKWDAIDVVVRELDKNKGVQIDFTTAWNPPKVWIEKVIEKYPKCSFTLIYIDGEWPKCGKISGRKGEVQVIKEYENAREASSFRERNFK